jgi:hypothetical protein
MKSLCLLCCLLLNSAFGFGWHWEAPTNGAPDFYELQIVTNLAQWNELPLIGGKPNTNGIGCAQFDGQRIWTHQTNYFPPHIELGAHLAKVRAWKGIECSDWGTVRIFTNSQPLVAPKLGVGGSTNN